MKRKYTEKELRETISSSYSIRQTVIKLNLVASGANYKSFKKIIKNLNIDTSHFRGKAWCAGFKFSPKRPIEDYLSNKYNIGSNKLRIRLIKENIFEEKCYCCNLKIWNFNPIPLELHHIDGNHENNNIKNLIILCPNCHAQTDNHKGKNIKIEGIKTTNSKKDFIFKTKTLIKKEKYCIDCNKNISIKAIRCKSCKGKNSTNKIIWPSIEILNEMLINSNYLQVGKTLGVSDNAVRKRIKNHSK